MTRIVGVVMDPIAHIKPWKDTTFAMMLEAQKRGFEIRIMELTDLSIQQQQAWGRYQRVEVQDHHQDWYRVTGEGLCALSDMSLILMRKDPPFDLDYVTATWILDLAQQAGCPVVNRPDSLRNANEKLFTAQFPQCCPPSIISSQKSDIDAFQKDHPDVILKPLDGMGGTSIFRVRADDPNRNVIIETLTEQGTKAIMCQAYLAAISDGDKRILLIAGEPVEYALARIPQGGETRGNLAAGGRAEGRELSSRDRWISAQLSSRMRDMDLDFVGIDVIGDYLTEINVTSPTCLRELEAEYGIDIKGRLWDHLETRLS